MNPDDLDAAAAGWTVLSTAFGRQPEQPFVAALRDPRQLSQWPYDDPDSMAGRVLLQESGRAAADGDPREGLRAIQDDHRRLFVGPRPLLAAPWESVYRSREGLVFDAHTLQVRQAYRRFGLQSAMLHREPDDHLALEASFLAALSLQALDALEQEREAEVDRLLAGITDFAHDHLSQWVPDLLDRVEAHARTDYHLGIAALTRGALRQLMRLSHAVSLR